MMNNKKELDVFHARSSQGVISAGYKLYMANFRKLLRSSWVVAVVYALSMGAFGSYYIAYAPRITVMAMSGTMASDPAMATEMAGIGLVMLLLSLLFMLVATVLASYGYAACKEHADTGAISAPAKWYGRWDWPMLWRTCKCVLWLIAISVVADLFLAGLAVLALKVLGKFTALIAIGVLTVILVAALLPLIYAMTKYVLTPKTHFLQMAGPAYVVGMRHVGSIFLVTLVVLIITALLTLVVQLPANILYIANLQSQIGALQGDPLGVPDYMGRLNFVVFALMGFLQGYIHLSTLFPYYFLYGSIEKQEEERRQLVSN